MTTNNVANNAPWSNPFILFVGGLGLMFACVTIIGIMAFSRPSDSTASRQEFVINQEGRTSLRLSEGVILENGKGTSLLLIGTNRTVNGNWGAQVTVNGVEKTYYRGDFINVTVGTQQGALGIVWEVEPNNQVHLRINKDFQGFTGETVK